MSTKEKLLEGYLYDVELYVGKSIFAMKVDQTSVQKSLQQSFKSQLDLYPFSLHIGGFPQELIHKVTNNEYSFGFGGCIGQLKIKQWHQTSKMKDTFFGFSFNENKVQSENFLMYYCSKICSLARDQTYGYAEAPRIDTPWYVDSKK